MTTSEITTELEPRRRAWRSRWAAIGAAVAVSFGAGGIFISSAASTTSSSFVPITPVRVLDTRTGLGLTGVFTSPVSRDLLVTGTIATADGVQLVVPAGATAVSLNVTVVGPSADGFLSVRPADAAGAPTTSSLNFAAGQVIPNAVTVKVPTSGGDAGRIEITYNALGVAGPTTHILVDIVGYYQATASGPADGTPCTAGGLAGTIVNGSNGDGEATVKCFRNLVTTLAGTGASGTTDGTNLAEFSGPFGVAVDAAGNVYVADFFNHRIRKITAAGVVSTLAGSTYGYFDGIGAAAQFYGPRGVAVDAAGNVYVADSGNNRIRKITAAGEVTTLAGQSTAGTTDATGIAAQFNTPRGVAVDVVGNVYVADTGNHRIRKITPVGAVSTLAGSTGGYLDATGTAAQFNLPAGVAVDTAGNVYVADTENHRIRKITAAGVVTTLAGGLPGTTDATGTAAQFNTPTGVAVDTAGNLYVADYINHRIRKITPAGVVSTLAGSTLGYLDGIGAAAQLYGPLGVAVDAAGNLYVADFFNNRIRQIN